MLTLSTFFSRLVMILLTSYVIFALLTLPVVAQEDSATTLLRAGNTLREEFDYKNAIDYYQRALDHNPNNVAVLYEIAFAYLETGNIDRSLDMALQGTRLQSEQLPEFNALVSLNYNYAIIISEYYENLVNRHDSEVVAFRKYHHDRPEGASKNFDLGLTYWSMGRNQIAESCLQESIELDTTLSDAPFILGLLWLQQGKYRDARIMLKKFLFFDPDSFLRSRVQQLLKDIERKEKG